MIRLFRHKSDRRKWPWRRKFRLIFALLVTALIVVVLWPYSVIVVPPGSVGVLWLRFFGGTVAGFHYNEGTHLIFPWDQIYVFDARVRRLDERVHALTRDGLDVDLDVWLTYQTNPDLVGDLLVVGGPDYEQTLLGPLVLSQTVLLVSSQPVAQLYAGGLGELAADVRRYLSDEITSLTPPNLRRELLINVSGVNIVQLTLPQAVRAAIAQKIQTEQDVLRYRFVIEREREESERKAIEAEGIRRFQETVARSISDSYLRWQGIDATLKLAQSPNAKIVVIGNSASSGLPLILGGFGDSATTPDAPKVSPPASPAPTLPGVSSSLPLSATPQSTSSPPLARR